MRLELIPADPQRLGAVGAQKGADVMHNVYQLWCARWWVALQLLRQGVSVLSLDVDAVLLSDVYALLHAPPLGDQDVVITRNSDNSQSLNCGFVYFNRRAQGRGAGGRPALRRRRAGEGRRAAAGGWPS